jgi:hypothetical protein
MTAWFAPMAIETRMGASIAWCREASDRGQALLNAKAAGCAVKNNMAITALALAACSGLLHAQTVAAAPQTAANSQEQSGAAAGAAPAGYGLSDLDAMTFSCPKAGLNAAAREAAREAARVRSRGTYQFAYFRIIDDSHYATYEIHFKSNYVREPDLKYCVSLYCQQGWDPETAQVSVDLIGDERRPVGGAAHGADCGNKQAPAKRD